ncbi:MAG: SGNH/GDSL hydrolase family protein [Candidatus Hodarchaeales archaeon]|jgi:lysophospholipase L1-like esterase
MVIEVFFGLFFLFLLVFLSLVTYLRIRAYKKPSNRPEVFLKKFPKGIEKKIVVCIGDSITHGTVSVNYVKMLIERLNDQKYHFINAGINAQLAYNVYLRLDEIIACQPDFITILIGTNDVNASLSDYNASSYTKTQKLPKRPSIEFYRENLTKIVSKLKKETKSKIALLSLPIIGEDLKDKANKRILEYNSIIKDISIDHNISYLFLNEKQEQFLKENNHLPKMIYNDRLVDRTCLKASIKYFLFLKNLDQISKDNGFLITTDFLHMNSTGAKMITDLIEKFILSKE